MANTNAKTPRFRHNVNEPLTKIFSAADQKGAIVTYG